MRRKHFVGLDVHCQFTEMAIVSETGKLIRRQQCPTTIPALVRALQCVPRPLHIVLEEGPLADWLCRNLAGHADEVTVCDPRRNHLIANDPDKDDPIDAEKLAQLLRGNFIRPVHHSKSLDRLVFKQHVALYHDCVRQRVRAANRISALLRSHGLFVREKAFSRPDNREKFLKLLPSHFLLRANLEMLWGAYDMAAKQVIQVRQRLKLYARDHEPIRRFVMLPGVKWVRAATFFAYIDTPGRFASKQKLWKYVGIGLVRRKSGAAPTRVSLVRRANRRLKYVLVGAARSAVNKGNNPFAEQYRQWVKKGCSPRLAMRNTARSLAATLWAMWKHGTDYQENRIRPLAALNLA
jgi:transposase